LRAVSAQGHTADCHQHHAPCLKPGTAFSVSDTEWNGLKWSIITVEGDPGRAICYKSRMQRSMRIIGLAGWSGSGKTTLITKLLPHLIARGQRVSTLKHAHHGFDLDQPGKDSFMHRTAGATEVVISSAKRFAVLHELRDEPEWDLPELLTKFAPVDLVLVEGFKRDSFPKLEIHRAANGKPLIQPDDPHVVAIASDIPLPQAKVPVVGLDDIEAIADVLLQHAAPLHSVAAAMRGT